MPTLRRDDGIQFVTQSYRELLTGRRLSVLRSKVRSLAIKHGEYVRLFKQDVGKFDAVFSREAGYLLGETVWYHFGKPANMIFCEALPEKQQALLVVVRSNSVYIDTKLSYAAIIDECASLALAKEKYAIYAYGDVPLSDASGADVFAFDSAQVESFTHLVNPVFNQLVADPALQLQPLELVLTSSHLNRPLTKPMIFGAIILLVLFAWMHFSTPSPTAQEGGRIIPMVDPYSTFHRAMTTPAPMEILAEFNNLITLMYTLPGWQVTEINYRDEYFSITLQRTGGRALELQSWASAHGASLQNTSNGVQLKIKTAAMDRPVQQYIYSLSQVTPLVMDHLSLVITRESIVTGSIAQSGAVKNAALTLNFSNFSTAIMDLVGRVLDRFPIELVSIVTKMQDNLLSGNIQLNVWGN